MSTNESIDLSQKYSFWYHLSALGKAQNENEYKEKVKRIATFNTLQNFWNIFQHLKKPEQLKSGIELELFKEGIQPLWEDPANKNGGRISLRIKKEYTNLIWEELIFNFIGNHFPKHDLINGLLVSNRRDFNYIHIWIKDYSNKTVSEIDIPDDVEIDAKPFYNKE